MKAHEEYRPSWSWNTKWWQNSSASFRGSRNFTYRYHSNIVDAYCICSNINNWRSRSPAWHMVAILKCESSHLPFNTEKCETHQSTQVPWQRVSKKIDFWINSFLIIVLDKSAFSFAGFDTNTFHFVRMCQTKNCLKNSLRKKWRW
jgi:hypothetical protein